MSGFRTVDELPPDGGIVYESLAPLLFVTIPGEGRFLVKRDRLLYTAEDVDFEALGGPVVQLSRGQFMQRLIEDMTDGLQIARAHHEIATDLPLENPYSVADIQDRNITATTTLIQRLMYERMLEQDMSAWDAAMRADQEANERKSRTPATPGRASRPLAPNEGVLLPPGAAQRQMKTQQAAGAKTRGAHGAHHQMEFFDAVLIGVGLSAIAHVIKQMTTHQPLFNTDDGFYFLGLLLGILCRGIVAGAMIHLIARAVRRAKSRRDRPGREDAGSSA